VDDDGTAYLSYWMLWGARGIGLAQSRGPDFDSWTKLKSNPVINRPHGESPKPRCKREAVPLRFRRSIEHLEERRPLLPADGQPAGPGQDRARSRCPLEAQGDRLYLFVSDNLKDWKYLHVFYERNAAWTDRSEDNMCPSFLPLPAGPEGGPASGKHLLLFISHNKGCQYYVGDYRDDRFHPNHHGRMTWVDNTYFAPEALVDGQGRQIMWAWLTDNPPGEKEKGWSGVYGLPRTLWLGKTGPCACAGEGTRNVALPGAVVERPDGGRRRVQAARKGDGHSCELGVEIEVGAAQRCGVKVRASSDGQEETLLYYDAATKELVFDSTRSGASGRKVVERAPLVLKPGEPLTLRSLWTTPWWKSLPTTARPSSARLSLMRTARASPSSRRAADTLSRSEVVAESPSNPY